MAACEGSWPFPRVGLLRRQGLGMKVGECGRSGLRRWVMGEVCRREGELTSIVWKVSRYCLLIVNKHLANESGYIFEPPSIKVEIIEFALNQCGFNDSSLTVVLRAEN